MDRVFISYAREDIEIAKRLYRDLRSAGADPWLDTEKLFPGQDWKLEINRAVRDCTYFLALISEKSVEKKGYVQKELRLALDVVNELPPGKVYVIPVRLDDSRPVHEQLERVHWVDLFPSYDDGLTKIKGSLELKAGKSSTPTETFSSLRKRNFVNNREQKPPWYKGRNAVILITLLTVGTITGIFLFLRNKVPQEFSGAPEVPTAGQTKRPVSGLSRRPTLNEANNLTYYLGPRSDPDNVVTLVDGEFENKDYRSGQDYVWRAFIRPDSPYAFGDLDGDGVDELAVVFKYNTGGSGVFPRVAIVAIREGSPKNIAMSEDLGDRDIFNAISIKDGIMTVQMLTDAPGAGAVDASLPIEFRFRLTEEGLTEIERRRW